MYVTLPFDPAIAVILSKAYELAPIVGVESIVTPLTETLDTLKEGDA